MPTFPARRGSRRLYHSASFGRLVDLFVLDERQYRAAQPFRNVRGPGGPELGAPRALLGAQQLAFARGGIRRSKATWKVIANEVVMMPIKLDESTFDGFDAWQGYPVEREALLKTIDGVEDVVFVTGDYHAFIAGDVRTAAGKTVASEFVGGSVSSSTEPEVNAIIRSPGWGTPDAPQMPAGGARPPRRREPVVLRARLPPSRLRRLRGVEVVVQGDVPQAADRAAGARPRWRRRRPTRVRKGRAGV